MDAVPEKRTTSRTSRASSTLIREKGGRGTSLMRNHPPLGPYRRPMPRVLGGSWGVGVLERLRERVDG